MSDFPRPPAENPADSPPSASKEASTARRPSETFDTAEAGRLAGAALGVGREGLRAAWRKGKEAAAARGVTEESVRRTAERGRVIAAEQARRRGLGQAGLPDWPGDLSGTPDDRAGAGSSPGGHPAGERGRTTSGGANRRSPTRTMVTSAAGRIPSPAGRRRFGIFPAAAPNSAPIERRLAAFALDVAIFGLAFVVCVVAVDVLLGAAFGGTGTDGEWLGLSFGELLRVVAFLELGDVATGAASGATAGVQLLHLLGLAVYLVGMEARFGATVGKRLLGLRVVAKVRPGERVGVQRAAIRNACRVYDLLIPLWPLALLDLVVTLLSPRRQRSGDWFAGTIVIDQRALHQDATETNPGATSITARATERTSP